MLRKLGFVAALFIVVSMAGIGGVASAQDYPGGATVSVTPTVVLPCQSGTITGAGFPAGTTGTVTVEGTVYDISTDEAGSFSIAVTVPCAAVSGTQVPFVVTVGGNTASGSITVGSASSASGVLPVTGSGGMLARAGLALVITGGAVLVVGRSRPKNDLIA